MSVLTRAEVKEAIAAFTAKCEPVVNPRTGTTSFKAIPYALQREFLGKVMGKGSIRFDAAWCYHERTVGIGGGDSDINVSIRIIED